MTGMVVVFESIVDMTINFSMVMLELTPCMAVELCPQVQTPRTDKSVDHGWSV